MEKPKIKATNLQTITGLLISEQCNYKKAMAYKSQASDPSLIEVLDCVANCHKNRYNQLLDYLDSHK